jgi:hypothetical protein
MIDLEAALDPSSLRLTRMIQGGLAAGVLTFLLVTVFLAVTVEKGAVPQGMIDAVTVLSAAHVVLAFAAVSVGRIVFNSRFSPDRMAAVFEVGDSGQRGTALAGVFRAAVIVRLALLEAAALFGLVILLVAAFNHVLAEVPEFWGNGLSAAAFIVYALVTFPTRSRVELVLREKIVGLS